MAYDDKAVAEVFLNWIEDTEGGLAAWVEHYLNAGDEQKLKEIRDIYNQIKNVFGF
ncbi:MAG: hypothetical protein JW776_10810 [Candidatus Lokiarchaeota archaeon]|nr:hypothetical protein [Candidatus Lokiarchaeota archaeon]